MAQEEKKKKTGGRPRTKERIRNENGGQSTQEGLPAEYQRFSVIAKVENVNLIKSYAYTRRIPIRRAFDAMVEQFFEEYRKNPQNEELLEWKPGSYD